MTTTITGVLGQLAHQDENVLGLVRNLATDRVTFIHIPWEVAERLGGLGLLTPGKNVELTGHLCDHERYFVVTDAAAPT